MAGHYFFGGSSNDASAVNKEDDLQDGGSIVYIYIYMSFNKS